MTAHEIVVAGLGHRYTGAVLRIERDGRAVFERAYGRTTHGEDAPAIEVTTRFDVASLTKVIVAHAALDAVSSGRLTLDAPLWPIVDEWRAGAPAGITVRMLLAHTAGLPSGADYRTLFGASVEAFALERPLISEPGERVTYSDLGFIALGVVLARVWNRSLPAIVSRTGMGVGFENTGYRPRNEAPAFIPATECDAWRGRVQGSVHDEKAALMNGIAGHAGVFSTARDIARLADLYLAVANGRAHRADEALAREAIREQAADPVLRRGLGWALKTSDENSCGAAMSPRTFGHTGFTGTCIWADPERDLSIVLLTNAVYYGRRDLRDVRAAVCDAAVEEFGSCARSG